MSVSGMDRMRLHDQVLVQKIRGKNAVGQYASHLGRGEKYIFRLFAGEEFVHRDAVAQVQLAARPQDEVAETAAGEGPVNGRANQPAMSCYEDTACLIP